MSKEKQRDMLYSNPREMVVDFVFDDSVANVFPDMIRRSVPGYENLISLIGVIAWKYVQPHSLCYDLGCSLGAATLSMRQRILQSGCRIIAVDNAQAMIKHCRENIVKNNTGIPVDVVCANIQDIKISNASLVVLNFTLQFVDPRQRLSVVESIYRGLLPGGVLVLSDKVAFDSESEERTISELHYAFKIANNYSELEISQKRTALENVLIPDTIQQQGTRLVNAGFSQVQMWYRCFNFVSFLAIK